MKRNEIKTKQRRFLGAVVMKAVAERLMEETNVMSGGGIGSSFE